MFGMISFFKLPYQLSRSVEEPVIAVTTTWRGATPYEVEREIIEEQEKVLKEYGELEDDDKTRLKELFNKIKKGFS